MMFSFQLTDRAKLGSIILQSIKLGESLSDRMAVQLIVERLRRIPEGEGWIIDGFPTTYDQVKLLENALAGYEEERAKDFDPLLAPNPRPPPPPEPYKSIIDLVILFQVTNEMVIRRAAGRSCKHAILFLDLFDDFLVVISSCSISQSRISRTIQSTTDRCCNWIQQSRTSFSNERCSQ